MQGLVRAGESGIRGICGVGEKWAQLLIGGLFPENPTSFCAGCQGEPEKFIYSVKIAKSVPIIHLVEGEEKFP